MSPMTGRSATWFHAASKLACVVGRDVGEVKEIYVDPVDEHHYVRFIDGTTSSISYDGRVICRDEEAWMTEHLIPYTVHFAAYILKSLPNTDEYGDPIPGPLASFQHVPSVHAKVQAFKEEGENLVYVQNVTYNAYTGTIHC